MGPDLRALLQDHHRKLAVALKGELLQADRGGKTSGAGADDNDIELHRLPGRTLRICERHGHVSQVIPNWFDRSSPPGASRSACRRKPALLQFARAWHRLPT